MKNFLLILTAIAFFITGAEAQIIHVPSDQPTIQAGIDAAGEGDTVVVAENTYYENINFLGKAITVASEFILDGDTSHISKTIIDGSQSANPDTSSTVMMVSGEDTTSVLMGFTITGGKGTKYFTTNGDTNRRGGGGVIVHGSGGKIIHNIIERNFMKDDNYDNLAGAGIYAFLFNNHTLIIRDNRIRINSLVGKNTYGGGVGVHGGRLICEGNAITKNEIYSVDWAWGAGLLFEAYGDQEGNVVIGSIEEGIIRNNLISGNLLQSAQQGGAGGGYCQRNGFEGDALQFYNNIICHNRANNTGGGVMGYDAVGIYINNTIVDNSGVMEGENVAIATGEGGLLLFNNIIYSSKSSSFADVWIAWGEEYLHMINNIIGNQAGLKVGATVYHNYSDAPVFQPDSYELAEGSPGIGWGIDSIKIDGSWYYSPERDLFGNPRPNPIDTRVDLGAIESPYREIPVLSIPQDSWYQPDFIEATSSKDGWIFLVPEGTLRDLGCIQQACIGNSTSVTAGISAEIPIPDTLRNGVYWLYARDMMDNISEPREFNIIGVGIDDERTASIRIYPNPTTNFLTIETEISDRYYIEITFMNGQQILSKEVEGTSHQIDLSFFRKGVYFITIRAKDFVTKRKIIKL